MANPQCTHHLGNAGFPDWSQYPGHFGGALSKILVAKSNCGAARLDFKMSCYQPMAYVEEHEHSDKEQVYFALEGEGVLTIDGEKHVFRPNDFIYVPPRCRHALSNNGTRPLVFLVITVLI